MQLMIFIIKAPMLLGNYLLFYKKAIRFATNYISLKIVNRQN